MPAPPPVLSIFLVFICRRFSARSCRCIIALLLPRSVAGHVYKSGPFAPVVVQIDLHGCKLWVSAPVVVHWCCSELRQEPAYLNPPNPLFKGAHQGLRAFHRRSAALPANSGPASEDAFPEEFRLRSTLSRAGFCRSSAYNSRGCLTAY